MKFLKLAFIIAFAMGYSNIFAQEDTEAKKPETSFKITGEFRTISEYRSGYKAILPDSLLDGKINANIATRQRSRINFEYKSKQFESYFSIQDIRIWGTNYTVLNNNPMTLMINEAWGQFNFSDKLGLRIGRQQFSYGDGRLLWKKEYNDYGAAYDAFLLKYCDKDAGLRIDFGLAANGTNQYYDTPFGSGAKFFKDMAFVYAEKKFGDHQVYFMDMLEERENLGNNLTYVRNTLGVVPNLKFGAINVDAGFYYQMGSDNKTVTLTNTTGDIISSTNGEKIAAMMYYVGANYNADMFSAGIAYEAYSGEKYDDDQTDLTNHTFAISPEMWAVHKYQGSMDYLVGGQTQAMKRGITDLSFFGQYGSKKTNLRADIHMLGHANEVMYTDTDGNEVKYKPFGTEVDLVFKKVLAKGMVMKVGYSIMLPGADHLQLVDQKMESSGMYGIDSEVEQKTAQWFHVTFSFKPTFFKHEK